MQGDPSLRDEQLQSEIDLVGALVLAASQADGPLTDELIDEILGVAPAGGGPAPRRQAGRPEPSPTG